MTRVSILFDHIYPSHKELYCRVMHMVLNASFNNISVISWWSVLLVEEIWVPRGNHRLVTSHWQTWFRIVVLSTPVTVLYLALHVQMYKKCIQSIVCSYMSDTFVRCIIGYMYIKLSLPTCKYSYYVIRTCTYLSHNWPHCSLRCMYKYSRSLGQYNCLHFDRETVCNRLYLE